MLTDICRDRNEAFMVMYTLLSDLLLNFSVWKCFKVLDVLVEVIWVPPVPKTCMIKFAQIGLCEVLTAINCISIT